MCTMTGEKLGSDCTMTGILDSKLSKIYVYYDRWKMAFLTGIQRDFYKLFMMQSQNRICKNYGKYFLFFENFCALCEPCPQKSDKLTYYTRAWDFYPWICQLFCILDVHNKY